MKKKLSLLLLICILSALNINAEIYNGSCGENVNYSLNTETGLLSITGTGAMTNYNSSPWSSKWSIKVVEISDGVTSIGDSAFENCSGLTSVTIPNSVTSIGESAFEFCLGLTSVTIPNSVTSIGKSAFNGCSGLTSVTIGNSVTSIGNDAFDDCYFTEQNLINNSSLDAETNNYWGATIVDSRDDGFVIKDGTLLKYTGNDASVTIPNSVTSIGHGAFFVCSGLTSVTIPNSVTSIGSDAFKGCSGLTSVTIPNSVTSIGSSAFYGTAWYNNQPDGLVYAGLVAYEYKGTMPANTSITIKEGTLGIAGDAFYRCSGLTSVTIPNSVTSIGNLAFNDCSGLISVTIPNSVTSIGTGAFSDCSGLTSVTIGNSVTSIGEWAFTRCSDLTYVTIGNSVTSIGSQAFEDCSSLTSVTIPNSVTSIGNYAFRDCSGLISVTIPNSVTSIGNDAFDDCYFTEQNLINNSSLDAETNNYWGATIVDSRDDGFVIKDGTLLKYTGNDASVTIPNSVTSIGYSAFENCSGLTSVTIPNSVTSIGSCAFENCSGLTSVTIGNSVTSINTYAFSRCSGLTSVISEIEDPFAFEFNAFNGISSSCALTVPYGTRDAYIAAGWTTSIFKGGIVEMDPDAMNINMSANEIGTYCSPYDLDFSGVSGLKAYIMSGFSPSTSTLVLTPVTQVPAGTGLLLRGAEGNYEVPCTTTDMYYTNLLKGVTTATAIDPTDGEYTNFILSNGAHGIGFYTLSESGELAANKAYLQLPTASVASLSRAMRLVFADDITGIDEKKAETKKEDNIFYDLQGRRVDNPTQGLYIVNGKKVFINKH